MHFDGLILIHNHLIIKKAKICFSLLLSTKLCVVTIFVCQATKICANAPKDIRFSINMQPLRSY